MSSSETVDLSSEMCAKENIQSLNFEPAIAKVIKPISTNPIHHDHYFSEKKGPDVKTEGTITATEGIHQFQHISGETKDTIVTAAVTAYYQ